MEGPWLGWMLGMVVSVRMAGPGPLSVGRPWECGGGPSTDSGAGLNLWRRAKTPGLRGYCDLLAGVTARLSADEVDLEELLPRLEKADHLVPGKAAPKLLEGRAYARWDRAQDALKSFEEARRREPRRPWDPWALWAWARSLGQTGRREESLRAYQTLLPSDEALPRRDRRMASFEAGLVALSLGPSKLEGALSFLREATREGDSEAGMATTMALGLALDRAGNLEESKALGWDARSGPPEHWLASGAAKAAFLGHPAEGLAMVAWAYQWVDPKRSKAAWRAYLEAVGPDGAWVRHARDRENGVVVRSKAPTDGGLP